MKDRLKFYIDGAWVEPATSLPIQIVNPASEKVLGRINLGLRADVDRAVAAAKKAFRDYSRTSRSERLALLKRVLAEYQRRSPEIAAAISAEMGAPLWFAEQAQAAAGAAHLAAAIEALGTYDPTWRTPGGSRVSGVPIGVCALITPWNWPINQIACKVVPALAMGCTMVLKPSELAPFSAALFADVLDAAGVPAGVFNLINGDGETAGAALAAHPDVDMVSFTGSARAGTAVAIAAAPSIKRVQQELGGKSANIILEDADLAAAVTAAVRAVMLNAGQSCNAPTRLLAPRRLMSETLALARSAALATTVGDPSSDAIVGPVVSAAQWDKVQRLIQTGVDEGATLLAGGPGRPEGLGTGYYVRPTVFADVTNDMTIAREEIFGPVLCVLGYDTEEEAIEIANDTEFGLAAYVQGEAAHALRIAEDLRAGQVILNGAALDFGAPFGGFRRSGNGREWGSQAFSEFLEIRAIIGA